ncbi:ATPase [Cupriavidus gilardii]|uniref:AAA family ATPase n=1 Tax=Cupriavidus gilardii TaxID=82541 RepID=UPI001EE61760|nr:AAA family ATPase [Cupriavidus gilardii]MCG5262202.1 AAA family ATPase [Cupriavidus gilardii]MDF9430332.1 ATPase [Cupriavidus gilardii]
MSVPNNCLTKGHAAPGGSNGHHTHDRLIVFTGGPGSGKSTLIDALEQQGYARSQEAGRAIIQDQIAIDGPALPWRDRQAFAEAMLGWELRSYRLAQRHPGPVLFDRGVPDVIGYLRLCELPVPDHLFRAAAAFRYRPQVFIAPPWPAIYRQDAERKQTLDEAERTFDAVAQAYRDCNYALIELPRADVAARARFVIEHIGGPGAIT